jgi:hypothetical protein
VPPLVRELPDDVVTDVFVEIEERADAGREIAGGCCTHRCAGDRAALEGRKDELFFARERAQDRLNRRFGAFGHVIEREVVEPALNVQRGGDSGDAVPGLRRLGAAGCHIVLATLLGGHGS